PKIESSRRVHGAQFSRTYVCSILSRCRVKTTRKPSFLRALSTLNIPPAEKPLLSCTATPRASSWAEPEPWKEVNMRVLRARDVPSTSEHQFSIHLARRVFDRRATSQLILRAVLSLGVPNAQLNERNDICVGEDKMRRRHVSGSAYKIVSARAYHHGTMLISTQLDTLGDLLRADKDKDTMVTKGVASVRSPVCNLQQTSPHVEHDSFVRAVVDEFRREYAVDEADDPVHSTRRRIRRAIPYIQNGISELQSWDWLYGQTPEFTYTLEKAFEWGSVTAELRAKHGIILSCGLRAPSAQPRLVVSELEKLGALAEGERYGKWPPPNTPDGMDESTRRRTGFGQR
ncbi:hypothetical protein B0H13DRAFT_2043687, partial [Mycena leptocephala]